MKLPCWSGIANEALRQLPSTSNDINGNNGTEAANNCGIFMVPEKHFVAVDTEEGHGPGIWPGFLGRIPSFANVPEPL